jgi:hypothetical protein
VNLNVYDTGQARIGRRAQQGSPSSCAGHGGAARLPAYARVQCCGRGTTAPTGKIVKREIVLPDDLGL